MQNKPSDKFSVRECHFADSICDTLYNLTSHFEEYSDSMIASGNFVGVSTQIFHHRRTSKGFKK
jgi:hypothetical protein